jgi:hypothetical protein
LKCGVFYHDHCFDGACSASIFTRFHRECIGTAQEFSYIGLMHRAGSLFDESAFVDGENAIVDFKYFTSPRVTWWFDHHQSAFLTPEDHKDFLNWQANAQDKRKGGKFYDPNYISCTGLIADVARERFGFGTAPLAELIYWANIVDGAKYESAEAAVEMAAHRAGIELLRQRTMLDRGVVTFDITDRLTEGYNKFIPYYLHPAATYNVGLSRSSFRTKVSVGTNPWTKVPVENLANLAAICERYGGGGHARVGAVSFPPDQEDTARKAAAEIAAELRARA